MAPILRTSTAADHFAITAVAVAIAASATSAVAEQRVACIIKGNISFRGERISRERYYDKTQIDTSKGERWFCTEQEAVGAGWQKVKVFKRRLSASH